MRAGHAYRRRLVLALATAASLASSMAFVPTTLASPVAGPSNANAHLTDAPDATPRPERKRRIKVKPGAEYKMRRAPHGTTPAAGCAVVTAPLSNGSSATDGSLNVTVDGLGAFGSSVANGPIRAIYNPFGSRSADSTVYTSNVYIDVIGRFLNDSCSSVVSQTSTSLVTTADLGPVRLRLSQSLGRIGSRGSTLTQTYRITNQTGSTLPLELVRHVDGDLLFSGSVRDDGGASTANGSSLYEFEWTDDHDSPSTYVGISGELDGDKSPDRWTIQPYDYLDDIANAGGIPSADAGRVAGDSGDGVVGAPYDVTLSQQWGARLGAGDSVVFTTRTKFGAAQFDEPVPTALFNATWKVDDGNELEFDGRPSTNAQTYRWDFGDGHTSSQVRPRHRFGGPGEYQVSLTVTGEGGQSDSSTEWVTVNPVRMYAPILSLHPREDFNPYNADTYISKSSLKWSHDDACPDHTVAGYGEVTASKLGSGGYSHRRAQSPASCAHVGGAYKTDEFVAPKNSSNALPDGEHKEGFYLNANDYIRGGSSDVSAVPIYYEYVPRHYIVYWFFYAYDFVGAQFHEGDWEHITVNLDRRGDMTDVAYYQHACDAVIARRGGGDRTRLTVSGGEFDGDSGSMAGTHPNVYVANGTHASYWRPGTWFTRSDGGGPCGGGDLADAGGTNWSGKSGRLVNARARDWYGFGGTWGSLSAVGVTNWWDGPLGPSSFKLRSAKPEDW